MAAGTGARAKSPAGRRCRIWAQSTPAALIARYAAAWWQVDAAYRRFRTRLDRAGGGLILVDALRYELVRDLAARLDLGQDALQVAVSPLPSITELGMAALLPDWEQFRVDYAAEWVIHGPGNGDNLARKDKRLAWLTAHVGKAAIFDLDQWLATPLEAVEKDAGWLIVTSQTIDAIGEGAGTVALHTFDALLERLAHGVRRLLAAGCTEITLVTNHGFLLCEAIRETGKVKAREPGLLKKSARYAIAPGADWATLPHFPIPGSELRAWFPCGVDCFLIPGPYNYRHGGGARQEVVIFGGSPGAARPTCRAARWRNWPATRKTASGGLLGRDSAARLQYPTGCGRRAARD